jgi:hypothetical protein
MSSSSRLAALLFVLVGGCSTHPTVAAEVCPVRAGQPLRFVDVFDGPTTEMATLVPDKGDDRSGYWSLGYVYDANRFVVIRCKYADKKIEDVKLTKRVDRCEYALDSSKTLKISCK